MNFISGDNLDPNGINKIKFLILDGWQGYWILSLLDVTLNLMVDEKWSDKKENWKALNGAFEMFLVIGYKDDGVDSCFIMENNLSVNP